MKRSRKNWILEEDEAIEEGIRCYGTKNWKRIEIAYGPEPEGNGKLKDRIGNSRILNRAKTIAKRRKKEGIALGVFESLLDTLSSENEEDNESPKVVSRRNWKDEWTEELNQILLDGYAKYGNKWTDIRDFCPEIKHIYNGMNYRDQLFALQKRAF